MGESHARHSALGISCMSMFYWGGSLPSACIPEDSLTRLQTGSFYYLVRYALNRLDLENDKEQATRRNAAAAILRRLDPQDQDESGNSDGRRKRRSRKEDLVLNQYEQVVAMDVVASEDIPVAFDGTALPCLTPFRETNGL